MVARRRRRRSHRPVLRSAPTPTRVSRGSDVLPGHVTMEARVRLMLTRKHRRSRGRAMALATPLALAVLVAACTVNPVGVTHIDSRAVHERLTRSALSTGKPSIFTENVLLEAGLVDLYDKDPEKALQQLHDHTVSGSGGPDGLFAAAEASFLYA